MGHTTILLLVVILLLGGPSASAMRVQSLKLQEQAKMEAMTSESKELNANVAVFVDTSKSDGLNFEDNVVNMNPPHIPVLSDLTLNLTGHRLATWVFVEKGRIGKEQVLKTSFAPSKNLNSLIEVPISTYDIDQEHLVHVHQDQLALKKYLKVIFLEVLLFFGGIAACQLLIKKLKIKMSSKAGNCHFVFEVLLYLFLLYLHYSYFHVTLVTHSISFLIQVVLSVSMALYLHQERQEEKKEEEYVVEVQYVEYVDEEEEVNDEWNKVMEVEQEKEVEQEEEVEYVNHLNEEWERVAEVDVEQVEEVEETEQMKEVNEEEDVQQVEEEVLEYVDEEERRITPV